jgi:hypothetical protein
VRGPKGPGTSLSIVETGADAWPECHNARTVTGQRRPLNWGLVGALVDIGAAVLFTGLLFAATAPSADVVPRPLFLGLLYAMPGVVGLLGVRSNQAWLLVAGGLSLIPGVFLSFTGITLTFVVPAVLMLVGAASVPAPSGRRRIGLLTGFAALVIAGLIVLGGWVALFGITVSACRPLPDGETCGDSMISGSGLLVALACLGAALAIASIGAGVASRRQRSS